jgi:L-fuconolactonase
MLPAQMIAMMDSAGVDRAVIVPPSWEGDRNDLALLAVHNYPRRFAVMGRVSLQTAGDADSLRQWYSRPGMLGFRLTFSRAGSAAWMSDGTADWFWQAAEEVGVPVYVYCPGYLAEMGRIAARHSGIKIVIDHIGLPVHVRDDQIVPVINELTELATLPNVAVKVSSLPSHVSEPYPFPSLFTHVRRLVDVFGPARVFWGSDVTRLPVPYRQAVSYLAEVAGVLSEDELAWIMSRGVSTWLNWAEDS